MLSDFDNRFEGRDLVTHAHRNPSSSGDTTMPAAGVVLGGPTAIARVDHGRWIADCPTEGCHGAEFVSVVARIPFFCTECRNAATGHVPIPVVLPSENTVAQIDELLSARPAPATRNWSAAEDVAQLRAENISHGIEEA